MATLFKPTKTVPLPKNAPIYEEGGKSYTRFLVAGKLVTYTLTKCGTKYLKPSRKWYGKYTDGDGRERRTPLTADKSAARMMLADLVKKAERRRIGLFDPAEEHAARPLLDHLDDYAAVLASKGDTPEHIDQTRRRISAILTGCGFVFARDAEPVRVAEWLNERRRDARAVLLPDGQAKFTPAEASELLGISGSALRSAVKRHGLLAAGNGKSRVFPRHTVEVLTLRAGKGAGPQTVNHYVRAVRGFFRWLAKVKRIGSNPLDSLELLNAAVDVRRGRRELTVEELRRLFCAARASTRPFRGLTGEDRYQLYLTAAGTGFRASALANLTTNDFALGTASPTVTLAAQFNKSRKPKVQPLPGDVAESLKVYLAGRSSNSKIWGGTWAAGHKAAEMLRSDLEVAGIPYFVEGSDGPLYADFHAIRHSFLTLGGRSGIDLRTLQELAGHSKPEQTARYSHRRLHDLTGAVGKLPRLVLGADTAPKAPVGVRGGVPKDVPTVCIGTHPVAQICSCADLGGEDNGIGEVPQKKEPGAHLRRAAVICTNEGDGGRTRNLRSDSPVL